MHSPYETEHRNSYEYQTIHTLRNFGFKDTEKKRDKMYTNSIKKEDEE